jgi:hypothetical protein
VREREPLHPAVHRAVVDRDLVQRDRNAQLAEAVQIRTGAL